MNNTDRPDRRCDSVIPPAAVAALMAWFRAAGRALPWRGERDPYLIWVSEVMLQQTQVSVVIPRYIRWRKRFPSVEALAAAEVADVLKEWEGLGYYTRARNLHEGAKFVLTALNGHIPGSYGELLRVPGIGPYTAAAVASIGFNEPVGVVDGNVARTMARLLRIGLPQRSPEFHRRVRSAVESSFGCHEPRWINQAWMEIGALICRRRPGCLPCPLHRYCAAAAAGDVANFPLRPAARAIPERTGAIFIIERAGAVLMVQRPLTGLLGGLWELPNAMADEQPAVNFIISAGLEEVSPTGLIARHRYSHFAVSFEVFRARLDGDWRHPFWRDHRWANAAELAGLPRPQVHIKALIAAGLITA